MGPQSVCSDIDFALMAEEVRIGPDQEHDSRMVLAELLQYPKANSVTFFDQNPI